MNQQGQINQGGGGNAAPNPAFLRMQSFVEEDLDQEQRPDGRPLILDFSPNQLCVRSVCSLGSAFCSALVGGFVGGVYNIPLAGLSGIFTQFVVLAAYGRASELSVPSVVSAVHRLAQAAPEMVCEHSESKGFLLWAAMRAEWWQLPVGGFIFGSMAGAVWGAASGWRAHRHAQERHMQLSASRVGEFVDRAVQAWDQSPNFKTGVLSACAFAVPIGSVETAAQVFGGHITKCVLAGTSLTGEVYDPPRSVMREIPTVLLSQESLVRVLFTAGVVGVAFLTLVSQGLLASNHANASASANPVAPVEVESEPEILGALPVIVQNDPDMVILGD